MILSFNLSSFVLSVHVYALFSYPLRHLVFHAESSERQRDSSESGLQKDRHGSSYGSAVRPSQREKQEPEQGCRVVETLTMEGVLGKADRNPRKVLPTGPWLHFWNIQLDTVLLVTGAPHHLLQIQNWGQKLTHHHFTEQPMSQIVHIAQLKIREKERIEEDLSMRAREQRDRDRQSEFLILPCG